MSTKRAADLKPGDIVDMPGGKRVVDRVEFTGQAIDSLGTQGVRVHWVDHPRPNLLRVDKELTVDPTKSIPKPGP